MPRVRLQGRSRENQHPVGQIAMHGGWRVRGPSGGLYQRAQQASDATPGSPPASRAAALSIVQRYFPQSSKSCETQAV